MTFLVTNGIIQKEDEANLSLFVLNDFAVVEKTLWFGHGGIPFFDENIEAIEEDLKMQNRNMPEPLQNRRELFRITKRMLNKNRFYRSGLINIRLFVSKNKIDTLITSRAFETFDFPLNEQGLLVNFAKIKKADSGKSPFLSQAVWQQAKIGNENTKFNGSVILNGNDCICEGIESNIFLAKDGMLYTPALTSCCHKGILRPIVISLAKKHNIKTVESHNIAKPLLMQMDEVFFVSEKHGIQWVVGIENRRFVIQLADFLHKKLNILLQGKK